MIVIVEGIEGSGKTTLCKRLEKELGFKYFNDPYYEDNAPSKRVINEKLITALEFLKLFGDTENIVIDRFHASEYVYGMLERRYVNLFVNKVDRELAELEAKGYYVCLILMNPESAEHLESCQLLHNKHLEKHAEVFVDYIKHGTAIKDKMIIDRTEVDDRVISKITNALKYL